MKELGGRLGMKYNIPDRTMRDVVKFAKKNSIIKVILFGSRAKDTNGESKFIIII